MPAQDRLAAIVYDGDVAIDMLMSVFARELIDAGFNARGLVQTPRDSVACGPRALVLAQSVEDGNTLPICHDLHQRDDGCSLDRASLAAAAARLRLDILQDSDIVFIPRFGRQEAQAGGFLAEFALAIEEKRNVLTAVRRDRRGDWLAFAQGRCTLLDHRLSALRDWWRRVSSDGRRLAGGATTGNRRRRP